MGKLGIQWQILLAQTISFSFVLFVLWRFAYRPVFAMLEARRQKIADAVANSERIKAELAKTEADRTRGPGPGRRPPNKMIEHARAAALRVREMETQKAVAAAEQIIVQGARSRRAGPCADARRVETRSRPAGRANHRDRHRQGADRRRPKPARRGNGKAIDSINR